LRNTVSNASTEAANPRHQPKEYIVALSMTFPCLRGKIDDLTPRIWDPDRFIARFHGASASEVHGAKFILSVWYGSWDEQLVKEGNKFDALAAVNHWDKQNRAAFADWVMDPRFP
jgi:hypothetical protein